MNIKLIIIQHTSQVSRKFTEKTYPKASFPLANRRLPSQSRELYSRPVCHEASEGISEQDEVQVTRIREDFQEYLRWREVTMGEFILKS